jgi:alkylation response protein AidB-like acyl-CoA dehydrogenase
VYIDTEEHSLLRDSVGRLARSYGHRYYLEQSRAGLPARELWEDLGRHGFLGANIPVEYGGAGGGLAELAIIGEELAAAGTPSFLLIITCAICAELVLSLGTEEQKASWLPEIAEGRKTMAFAITEPDAGLNTHKLTTTATRKGDTYVLRGSKYYSSGADTADAILVVARNGNDSGGQSLLIVDSNAPGLDKQLIQVELTAPEKQFMLFFDDVEVPSEALLGTEGQGLRHVFAGLNPERVLAAALENGIGLYALEKASQYARERDVWGVPIGAHQGVAHPLAKAKIEVELARLMTHKAAWLHDNGLDAGEAANMAKYAAAEACLAALDQAIQTHGGNGLATDYGLATLWGVARLQRTAPVSREMIFNYVAQRSLGLPRSY